MSLNPTQLAELQTIAQTIQDQFSQNQDESWWAGIRIQNAGLGPDGAGGAAGFQSTLDDIKTTQGQINPYQSRLGGVDRGFTEAVLQVVGSAAGTGVPYFTTSFVGSSGAREHTLNGAADSVGEAYDQSGLSLVTGGFSRSATTFQFVSADIPNQGIINVTFANGAAPSLVFSVSSGVNSSSISLDGTGIKITPAGDSINIEELPAFADDAAAGVGGLTTGDLYQTTGLGSAPLNAAGIVLVKQ